MMTVFPAAKRNITDVKTADGAVLLSSEAGTLRLIPMAGGIVRVSFSEKGEFSGEQGAFYADLSGSIPFEVKEGDSDIRVVTSDGSTVVNRETGAVSFFDKAGRLLLKERDRYPRELEKITLYRTVTSDRIEVEEIVTADGVKKKVKAADKEICGEAYKTRTYYDFAGDEQLFGFGQGEHGEWNLRHSVYYGHQANRKIAIPLLLSSKNYGILLSTESLFMFSENGDEAFIQTEADAYLDHYFLFGEDLFSVVRSFRKLSGKAAMLPKWAYGYIQSKERYQSAQELTDTAEEFRKRNIGIDCLVLDWLSWGDNQWGQKSFDPARFPDPKAMVDALHQKGIRFMMSIWPNMSPNTENNKEFKARNLLLPGTDVYNAFSEEARELYWDQVKRALLPSGVDAWWCDSSEPITPEWEHKVEPSDGEKYAEFKADAAAVMPLEKANAFGRYHAMALWNGERKSERVNRVVNLTRSGWAGSQKYGTILWSGDISASWDCLAKQIRAGLQMASSGMPYWTLDTGAFFVKEGVFWYWRGDYPEGIDDAYRKLYVRWLEYSAFLPIFRAHGTDVEREPWAFGDKGDPYYEAICRTIRGRYRLLPYIYSVAASVSLDDGMMIRPLIFDFPKDRRAAEITDQYMFGDSLMICPIVSESDSRRVWLPEGADWFDFETNERYHGGQEVECECPIDRIPVFVKAGSVIPVMEPGDSTEAMKGSKVEARVYPGQDAAFKLYEDAGDGYGYEAGECCITKLIWQEREQSLKIETSGDERFRQGEIKVNVIR